MIELASPSPAIESAAQESVCLSIADIRIALHSSDPTIKLSFGDSARRFLVDGDEEADVRVTAAWGDLRDEALGELLFDSGALWQLRRDRHGYLWRFQTPYFGAAPYKVARFTRDFTRGEVLLHAPYFAARPSVNPLEYPLDELLMLNLLAEGRGAEIHSCGIVDEEGDGYLFAGQSGAGKTTTARLWERQGAATEILSDDRIIIRKRGGEFRMYGTPWHGEGALARAASAPLKRVFFLRHGLENRLTALAGAEASARLFSCSFPTFYNTDGLEFTLRFFEELTAAVPCYELSFTPEDAAVDFVRSGKVE